MIGSPSELWETFVRRQLGASMDMLEAAMRSCPDELWTGDVWDDPDAPGLAAFWYLAYHALFWLDCHLSGGTAEGCRPPAPFGLEELDPAGVLPPRVYTRDELADYLAHCRRKCAERVASLTAEELGRRCRVGSGELAYGELLVYTMRHVQEHAAQLNVFLGQRTGTAARWTGTTPDA